METITTLSCFVHGYQITQKMHTFGFSALQSESLFEPDFLQRIKFVMSDNCHTMGPVLEDACSTGQAMPNAGAYICVYHIERNFHADFGVSSRGRWNLKQSRMRKKGRNNRLGLRMAEAMCERHIPDAKM